ncbi:hypothetical protein [Alkalihalobacterium elongatum]|uniref:hypothetical protein n=1 Tax=Alkalihalobacterium elongatum TaxID=2675466 RepID=UPI001C1FB21B|nr:hypothetical protein [Alkalihalobacterium elongatum]
MKKEYTLVIIISIVSGLLFYIFNLLTPSPRTVSGNGNPALLLMPILLPLFVYLVFLWIKVLKNFRINSRIALIAIIGIVFHWFFGLYYQQFLFNNHRNVLADVYQKEFGYVDRVYIEQITSSLLSIHTNKLYFNLNTYLMFLTLSIFLSLSIVLIKKLFPPPSNK